MIRCGDGTLYTGITNDLERRLARHRDGTGAKYTRGRGRLRVILVERVRTKGLALRREAAIKDLSRAEKLSLIAKSRSRRF